MKLTILLLAFITVFALGYNTAIEVEDYYSDLQDEVIRVSQDAQVDYLVKLPANMAT